MIIIKIGGSLYSSSYLKEWCDQLAGIKVPIIIVPGGGPFADQVRDVDNKWHLSDNTAHNMAVMGMQQFGCLLININNKLSPLESSNNLFADKPYVWLPYQDLSTECDYPRNWQITSDSLAVWLACKMSASHLCLVKSAQIDIYSTDQYISTELVDSYFSDATKNYSGQIHFYHASQSQHFISDINNGKFN
ncbi:MAG: amino acid kinase [Gammaproteobacteria bacterium]|nr:amino acid kinase [Gammaproteobacteria bacterium]